MNKFDAVIVLAGPEFDRLSFQELEKPFFLIAVDGGLNHLKHCELEVDVHIGDMDSFFEDKNLPKVNDVFKFSSEKDYSDFQLAIDYLYQRNYKNIATFASTGGRVDHLIQLYETSVEYCSKGIEITAFGQNEVIYFTTKELQLNNLEKPVTISIFAGSTVCTGVSYSGMKYPLKDYTLKRSQPLGLSNQSTSQTVTINHREGVLVVVVNK